MEGIGRSHRHAALVAGAAALVAGAAALAAATLVLGVRLAGGDGQAPSTLRAGGAASEAAPAGVQDPCTLLTEAEAAEALGGEVVRLGAGRTCTFTVTTGGAFRALSVVSGLEGADAGNFAEAVRTYAEIAGAQVGAPPDVGDEAYTAIDNRTSQLIARSGDRIVTIVLLGVDAPPDQRIATMTGVARTALSRLA